MNQNIVFLFADDWGRYASAYKKFENDDSINTIINTPNFDRIANEGVIFKNAYVPAPSCTPCRSSLFSGRYFWQTGLGAILQGAVWDTSIPTYPLELEKAGYHVGFTYKGWSPGQNIDAPLGGPRNRYYRTSDTLEYDQTQERLGRIFKFSQNVTEWSQHMSIEEAKEIMYSEVRNSFKAYLEANTNNKPMCYYMGPNNTHRAWEQGSGLNLWNIHPDKLKGKLPECLPDTEEVREDFSDYLGEVLAFDHFVGIIIEELEKINQFDNTLFVISGDHGVPGMSRAKCNLYNLGTEVALAMRMPSLIKSGMIIDEQINIMDLAPTFLEFANVKIPESMTAKSLMPLLKGEKDAHHNNFVIIGRERHSNVARTGRLPYPQRAIRTKDYLYIVNFEPDRWPVGEPNGLEDFSREFTEEEIYKNKNGLRFFGDMDRGPTKTFLCLNRADPEIAPYYHLAFDKRPYEELYDMKNGRYNSINLADDPAYSSIKAQLNEQLISVLIKEEDPRMVEEVCRFETGEYIL